MADRQLQSATSALVVVVGVAIIIIIISRRRRPHPGEALAGIQVEATQKKIAIEKTGLSSRIVNFIE